MFELIVIYHLISLSSDPPFTKVISSMNDKIEMQYAFINENICHQSIDSQTQAFNRNIRLNSDFILIPTNSTPPIDKNSMEFKCVQIIKSVPSKRPPGLHLPD